MDILDQTDEHSQPLLDAKIAALHARSQADNVPQIADDCDVCGEYNPRLVDTVRGWACSPCRDKYKLTTVRK